MKTETISKLPLPEQTFEWPRQTMQEKNWAEAALLSTVLRNVYPEHPAPWTQGAVAHIEAGELKVSEALLAHARQHFPNHPDSLTESARLAMRQQQWDEAEAFLQQAREKHPDTLSRLRTL